MLRSRPGEFAEEADGQVHIEILRQPQRNFLWDSVATGETYEFREESSVSYLHEEAQVGSLALEQVQRHWQELQV